MMICATRLSEKNENAATTSITPTLIAAIAPLLPTWLAAFAMPWLENASPRPVSMNGV